MALINHQHCPSSPPKRERLSDLGARCLIALLPSLVCITALTIALCTARPMPSEVFVRESRSADAVPRYDILELSFKHNGTYDNNFFDVALRLSLPHLVAYCGVSKDFFTAARYGRYAFAQMSLAAGLIPMP